MHIFEEIQNVIAKSKCISEVVKVAINSRVNPIT